MAWIESHQSLERHPKRADLSARMKWTKPETIGRLHMFWWWVLDFAEDGDLRKYNDGHIAEAMCVDIAQAGDLVEALVQARWLEREPYFRVRNWYGYIWRFLHARYGKSDVGKIRRIKELYNNADTGAEVEAETGAETALTNQPTLRGARARVESSVPTAGNEATFLSPLQKKEGWKLRKDLRETSDPVERKAIQDELKRRESVGRNPAPAKPVTPAKPKPQPVPFEKRKELWEKAKQLSK